MKKYITAILVLFLAMSCGSCFKEFNTDSLLDQEYDIVLGVLGPDSSNGFTRNLPVEIFVGKIVPTDIHNNYMIEGVDDSVLARLMWGTRVNYIAYYKPNENARVWIKNGLDSAELSFAGKGIYRDINHELTVKSGESYQLRIQNKDGRVFTSQTTVPNDVFVDSIDHKPAELDTLYAVPDTNRVYFFRYSLRTNPEPFYYVTLRHYSNFSFYVYDLSTKDEIANVVIFSKKGVPLPLVIVRHIIRAVNEDIGHFEHPYAFSVGKLDFYFEELEKKSIQSKSNIIGKDVVGVFGAYNETILDYVVKAVE